MTATTKIMNPAVANDVHLTRKYPTLMQIKRTIPEHLFQSSIFLSLYFVLKDILLILLLYATIITCERFLPAHYLCIAFPVYWYLQGTLLMALFVIGHDCGHGSFSRYTCVNDVIGTVLHAVLLTPYYPWKLSHKNHHKHTGNIDKDEVFYPIKRNTDNGKGFTFLFGLGIGWFVYLWRGYYPRRVCHFNPLEAMFGDHLTGCSLSISAVVGWILLLYHYACSVGFTELMKYYVIPEFVFASWLLVVTFLHHTEENTPWYSDAEWTFVKGQLSSVDRNYGWAHDIIHNIGTHQIHHLFSRIPHYNLEDATCHFRRHFPELMRENRDAILPSLLRMYKKFSNQFKIDSSTVIHVYK